MGTLISILLIIVSILLIFVVLIQNSKGGGLASNFASSNQVMGVRKTADFLEKATWTLAITLLVLSLATTPYSKNTGTVTEENPTESVTRKVAGEKGMPTATPPQAPVAPQNAPGNNPVAPAPAGGK